MSEAARMKESPPGLKNDDKHWSPPPLSPDGISGLPFSQPEPPPPGTPQSASSETNDGDKQIFTFKGPSGGDSTPAATESVAEVKVKDPHRSAFNGGDEPCWNFQNLENALAGEKTGETEEDDCDTKVAADAKKKVETANLFTINRASTTLLPRSPSAGGAASETHSPSARGAATESSGETFREMCDRASASMTGSPPRAPTSSAIGSTTESSVETFSEVCDRARAAARITVSSRVCTSNEVTSNEATTTGATATGPTTTGATATGPTTTESTTTESTTTEATATSAASQFLSFALHLGGIAGIGGTAGSDADIGPQDGAPPGFVELIAGNDPPIAQAALNQMIAGLFVNAFMQQIGESDDDSNSEDHLSELQSTLGGNEFLDGPIDCTFERRNRLTWDAAGSVNNPFKVWHYPPPHSNILLPEFENVDRSVGRVPSLLSLSCKAVDEFFRLLKAEVLEDPRNSKLHLDTLATFPPSTIKTVIASLKWDQLCPIYLSFHPVISAYITDDVLDVTIANWETAYRKFYGERLYRNSSEGKKEIPRMNESLSPLAFAEFTAKHTPFANMIHLFGFERKKRADQVTPPSYFFTYGAWGGPVSQHYLKFSGTLLDEEKRMKENKEEERKKKRKAKPKELFPSKKEEPPAKHQPTPSQKEEPLLSKGTSEAAEGATSPPPSTPVIITTIEEARRPSSSPAHPLLEPLKQIFSNASEIEGKLGKISAVTCKSNWLKNWDVFTSGSLKGLNWKNVICAGGSVLACTMPSKKEEEGGQLTDVERKAWLCADPAWSKVENCERSPYADSGDIDIFLHSMTRRQANAKLIAIQKTIQANSYSPVLVVKTRHAVTFVQGFPRRHIQVVLRIYSCPAEVLMGFDLDASCVGFDGKSDVFMLPRAVRALNLRANVVDLSRRSLSYEARLAKYATRGFSVYVKELDAKRISPVLFDLPLNCHDKFKEIVGLGKLLLIEKARFLSGSPHRIPDRSQVITAKIGEARSSGEMYVDPLKFGYTRRLLKRPWWWMPKINHGFSDEELVIAESAAIEGRDRAEKIQINDSLFGGKLNCDYSSIFLPFKEGYSVQKIKDLVSNIIFQKEWAVDNFDPSDWWEDESDDELETAMETCELIRAAPCVSMGFDISKLIHVRQWVTHNPGRQILTGSFHPLSAHGWADGVHLEESDNEGTFVKVVCIFSKDNIRGVIRDTWQCLAQTHDFIHRKRGYMLRSAATVVEIEKFKRNLAASVPPQDYKICLITYTTCLPGSTVLDDDGCVEDGEGAESTLSFQVVYHPDPLSDCDSDTISYNYRLCSSTLVDDVFNDFTNRLGNDDDGERPSPDLMFLVRETDTVGKVTSTAPFCTEEFLCALPFLQSIEEAGIVEGDKIVCRGFGLAFYPYEGDPEASWKVKRRSLKGTPQESDPFLGKHCPFHVLKTEYIGLAEEIGDELPYWMR